MDKATKSNKRKNNASDLTEAKIGTLPEDGKDEEDGFENEEAVTDDVEEEDDEDEEEDDESDYDVSESEEEEQDGDDDGEEIQTNFDFFDPKESDFHGLKTLLQTYLDGKTFNLSELADAIIAQKTVGTVVRTGEDELPIALCTVLNLRKHQTSGFMKDINAYLRNNCPEKYLKQQLDKALESEKTGLIVSERLVNCPLELSCPLQEGLFDEITWATTDEPTEEERQSFKFNKYIVFSKIFRDPAEAEPSSSKGPQTKKQKTEPAAAAEGSVEEGELVFLRPEDELFYKVCTWHYTFSVPQKETTSSQKNALKPLRIVMLVDASKIPAVRTQLKQRFAMEDRFDT